MKQILFVLGAVLLSGQAFTQVGPTKPRIVVAAVPWPGPDSSHAGNSELITIVDLAVGADGRVTGVKVTEPSGNEKLDAAVTKYYSKWRLVPAIDEQNTPVPGTVTMRYLIKPVGASRPPQSQPDEASVNDEVARIGRMTCKDFLWEYDFMKEIAGKRSINGEKLLAVSVALYVAKHKIGDDQIGRLTKVRDEAIHDTVEQCRTTPATKYWTGAFDPAMTAKLAN